MVSDIAKVPVENCARIPERKSRCLPENRPISFGMMANSKPKAITKLGTMIKNLIKRWSQMKKRNLLDKARNSNERLPAPTAKEDPF